RPGRPRPRGGCVPGPVEGPDRRRPVPVAVGVPDRRPALGVVRERWQARLPDEAVHLGVEGRPVRAGWVRRPGQGNDHGPGRSGPGEGGAGLGRRERGLLVHRRRGRLYLATWTNPRPGSAAAPTSGEWPRQRVRVRAVVAGGVSDAGRVDWLRFPSSPVVP